MIATEDMPAYCLHVVYSHATGSPRPLPYQGPLASTPCALFVTLKSTAAPHALRGCIGTFTEGTLSAHLSRYAMAAAFEDGRFSPVEAREVPGLSCSVTLLSGFEPCAHCYDWVVGVHGVRISFTSSDGKSMGATFLPQVMPEQGWDQRATIEALVKKAGYRGVVDDKMRRGIATERYIGTVAEVVFEKYKASTAI